MCLFNLNWGPHIVHVCVNVQSLNHIWLFATLWTLGHLVPLSMGFSRQEYWSGLPWPFPRDLPNLGLELGLLHYRYSLYVWATRDMHLSKLRSFWSRLWFFLWSRMDVRIGLWRKLSAEELMLLNCGVGEDRTGRPGMLWFMGSQRVGQDWATELNWTYDFLYVFTVESKLCKECLPFPRQSIYT